MRLGDGGVRLFADGADMEAIRELAADPLIAGFTTNPTLMRKAGVSDYQAFARELVALVPDRPVSFEVVSDTFEAMEREARLLAAWGPNVCVKIPVTNTRGEPSSRLVQRLVGEAIHVNVTAIMTLEQVETAYGWLEGCRAGYLSVFAGRIADTGRDPVPTVASAVRLAGETPNVEIVWASPREVLNVFQADAIGCHIITMTPDLLAKLALVDKDLDEFSLETVRMFHHDARAAALAIDAPALAATS